MSPGAHDFWCSSLWSEPVSGQALFVWYSVKKEAPSLAPAGSVGPHVARCHQPWPWLSGSRGSETVDHDVALLGGAHVLFFKLADESRVHLLKMGLGRR